MLVATAVDCFIYFGKANFRKYILGLIRFLL